MPQPLGRDAFRRARLWLAAVLLLPLLTAFAGPAAAQTSLRDLGFPDGFTLRGPAPAFDAFFPLPQRATRAELVIDLLRSPMLEDLSSVTIYANELPITTIKLASAPESISVPIPPQLLVSDFLRVRFQGDQALRRGVECFDNDTPAVWSRVRASTRLLVNEEGEPGLGVVWRRMTGQVPMALPNNPSFNDVEAALTVAMALVERGAIPVMVGPGDPTARIRVGGGGQRLDIERQPDGNDRIIIGSQASARALVALGSTLRVVPASVGVGALLPETDLAARRAVPIGDLGISNLNVDVYGSASLRFELPLNLIPLGLKPYAIRLFGRGAHVPDGEGVVIAAYVGQRLVWSETYRGDIELNGVEIALPPELVRHRMAITIRMMRIGVRRSCTYNDALAFQIRPTSEVLLTEGNLAPEQFSGLAFGGREPTLVRINGTPASAVPGIPLMARVLHSGGARAELIDVEGSGALSRPFLVYSETQPNDVSGAALTRPDRGRAVLENGRTGTRTEIGNAGGLTVVQLVKANEVPGIWISPGAERSLALLPGVQLTDGTVAVFDGTSLPVIFDARATTIQVPETVPDRVSTLFDRWRNEIFLVAWVLITLLAVLAVIRLRRRG